MVLFKSYILFVLLGHALGLYHEQSRPDRDDYVVIYRQNVIPSKTVTLHSSIHFTLNLYVVLDLVIPFSLTGTKPGDKAGFNFPTRSFFNHNIPAKISFRNSQIWFHLPQLITSSFLLNVDKKEEVLTLMLKKLFFLAICIILFKYSEWTYFCWSFHFLFQINCSTSINILGQQSTRLEHLMTMTASCTTRPKNLAATTDIRSSQENKGYGY